MVGWHQSLSKLQEMVKDREALCAQSMRSRRVGHNLVTEQQLQKEARPFGLMGMARRIIRTNF